MSSDCCDIAVTPGCASLLCLVARAKYHLLLRPSYRSLGAIIASDQHWPLSTIEDELSRTSNGQSA